MPEPHFLFLKDFKYGKFGVNDKGETWVQWILTPEQEKQKNKNLFWLTCFFRHDFCEHHLKRPHLTCVRCTLRRVIAGKLPLSYQIHICQVWSIEPKGLVHAWVFRKLLSLVETIS